MSVQGESVTLGIWVSGWDSELVSGMGLDSLRRSGWWVCNLDKRESEWGGRREGEA